MELVGPVFRFHVTESGIMVRVVDDSGDVVVLDRGRRVIDILFDFLGDPAPGGTTLDVDLVSMDGRFDTEQAGFDLCATVLADTR